MDENKYSEAQDKMNSTDDGIGQESSQFIQQKEYKMKNKEEKKKQL
jgi:hypothetical protein